MEKALIKTIRSSTPIRIADIGGWTDTWFSGEGNVLNVAVTPLVKVKIKVYENREKREERVLVRAENYDETFLVNPENPNYEHHPLLQGAISSQTIPKEDRLEISIHSDVPGGSSTGTSASVCVALLGGLNLLTPQKHSPDEIASLAHRVETEKLSLQSGIQDQISAAFGGVCFIHMYKYPHSHVAKLALDKKVNNELDRRLCLIYLGKAHSSSALHEEVIAFLERKDSRFKMIQRMRDLAVQARDMLLEGDISSFGELMIENNECQRALHTELIPQEADSVIELAKKYGAVGWKVNGAGGKGGSLTILASRDMSRKEQMLKEINALGKGIRSIPISLALSGLKVTEEA